MKKIIAIVGPTASGKTSFALDIAHRVLQSDLSEQLVKDLCIKNTDHYSGVDLISVDSRQVYKGLEILSGADIPENL